MSWASVILRLSGVALLCVSTFGGIGYFSHQFYHQHALPVLKSSAFADLDPSWLAPSSSIEGLQKQAQVLLRIMDSTVSSQQATRDVLILYSAFYIWKQSFAIPGSLVLNLLAGALYGPAYASLLISFLTAVGATICYGLSHLLGEPCVARLVSRERLQRFKSRIERVSSDKQDLVLYLLCIRLFPLTPNWLVNIASPLIGVPLWAHTLTVTLGLAPYNFFCAQTGSTLSTVRSLSDVLTWSRIAQLAFAAFCAFIPTLIRHRSSKMNAFLNEEKSIKTQ